MTWLVDISKYMFAIIPACILEYILLMFYEQLNTQFGIPDIVIFIMAIGIPLLILLLFSQMLQQFRDKPVQISGGERYGE